MTYERTGYPELDGLLSQVEQAAEGDSNDAEISLLQSALSEALTVIRTRPPRTCFWVDATCYVNGYGFRYSEVTENEAGHTPRGFIEATVDAYAVAATKVDEMNVERGITKDEALKIVASSMTAGRTTTEELLTTDGPDWIELARAKWAEDGQIEFDDDARVSEGDDPGAYVQGWLWVPAPEAGVLS